MSSSEFSEWQAYNTLEPFGEDRADLRMGILAATTVNMLKGKGKPAKVTDFIPQFGRDRVDPEKVLRTKLKQIALIHNATFKGQGKNG